MSDFCQRQSKHVCLFLMEPCIFFCSLPALGTGCSSLSHISENTCHLASRQPQSPSAKSGGSSGEPKSLAEQEELGKGFTHLEVLTHVRPRGEHELPTCPFNQPPPGTRCSPSPWTKPSARARDPSINKAWGTVFRELEI